MLPKISTPIYDLHLPLLKKDVKFRPFLVKEEKLLLMAVESKNDKTILDTIKQIISNCLLSEIDVDTLPIFDLEFLFLNLRARSINEIVELKYSCNNKIENKKENGEIETKTCGNILKFEINLLDIQPEFNPDQNDKIQLSDNLGIVMKYPTVKMYDKILSENEGKNHNELELTIDSMIKCIECIYDKDNIYYAKDTTKEELIEFIEGLTKKQFEKIEEFFEKIPKIQKDLDFKCNKCGYHESLHVEGIQNFFG